MGRTFHNLHVYADSQRLRARVVRVVLAYAKQAGYERAKTTRNADRVIRIGGRAPWLTIEDDGYAIEAIGKAIASAIKTPILEAYCEASARVGLGLRIGRSAGGWGWGYDRPPTPRLVEAILVGDGVTAAAFAKAWDEGHRQVFPETALAVAAKHFGIDAGILFGDRALRGTTIALRRRRAKWTPAYQTGVPRFEVGWGSNQGWGYRHLVFEEQVENHRVHVTSVGGPGKGLSIRLGGSAIERGLVEVTRCSHEALQLVRDGDTWRDPDAKVPAGVTEQPDIFELSRSESDKARRITDKLEWYIDVEYRALKEGEGDLVAYVESGGTVCEGTNELMVMWRPWRPSTALPHVDDHRLFQLHRRDQTVLHVALRGSLADAWMWARPHVEVWAAIHEQRFLHVLRGDEVLLDVRRHGDADPELPWERVAQFFPADARTPFQVRGELGTFGTFGYAPWGMDAREQLVVQLVLHARNPDDDGTENVARLSAIADDAIARGIALSAHLAEQQYSGEKTSWEEITVSDDAPLRLASWHEQHIRGLDKSIWLSSTHAAHIDRVALARHATIADLGRGMRVTLERDRPRREMEPLVALLAPVLPSAAAIERFKSERAAALALSAPPAVPAERVLDERA